MKNLLARTVRDRRGVALPVALIGLVAVSLLVTTAMLTSSTEFAISSAHRNSAASLFAADAAMEQYLAQRAQVGGVFLAATPVGAPDGVDGPDGRRYTVQVSRLLWTDSRTGNQLTADEVYSLLTQPEDGRGRSVSAFLRLRRQAVALSTTLNAGATSGGDLKVSGNATISDGRSGTNYCSATDNQSDYAVQVTAGSKIDAGQQADKRLEGAGDTTSYGKEAMSDSLLGGVTLQELADQASIQFGARWDQPAWTTTLINSDPGTDARYDWGCPAELGVTCPTEASKTRLVAVAIDAGGGTVKINGRYGQGMLVVLNGSLEIQGNFIYKGIILVEKDMYIRGGSAGQESKIEGGIVAFGASSTVEDNITGTATIKYNWCAIQDAEKAMNSAALEAAPQSLNGSTFAWYELIR